MHTTLILYLNFNYNWFYYRWLLSKQQYDEAKLIFSKYSLSKGNELDENIWEEFVSGMKEKVLLQKYFILIKTNTFTNRTFKLNAIMLAVIVTAGLYSVFQTIFVYIK